MSIKEYVIELNNLKLEIARLSKETKKLRQRSNEVQQQIVKYLKDTNQLGVKYSGTAIIYKNKKKTKRKNKKEKTADVLKILRDNDISNPEQVLRDIKRAEKGEEISVPSLNFKKIK